MRRLQLTRADAASDLGCFVIQALEVRSERFFIAQSL